MAPVIIITLYYFVLSTQVTSVDLSQNQIFKRKYHPKNLCNLACYLMIKVSGPFYAGQSCRLVAKTHVSEEIIIMIIYLNPLYMDKMHLEEIKNTAK